MAKTSKLKNIQLTKADQFYVENKCGELSLEQMSNDLNYPSSVIESYYNQCLDKKKKADTIDKLMVVNSKNGYAVMTKEASEKGEENRRRSSQPPENHIHRIRQ
jgi:hypothetical protein